MVGVYVKGHWEWHGGCLCKRALGVVWWVFM